MKRVTKIKSSVLIILFSLIGLLYSPLFSPELYKKYLNFEISHYSALELDNFMINQQDFTNPLHYIYGQSLCHNKKEHDKIQRDIQNKLKIKEKHKVYCDINKLYFFEINGNNYIKDVPVEKIPSTLNNYNKKTILDEYLKRVLNRETYTKNAYDNAYVVSVNH